MNEQALNKKLAEWAGIEWKITERTHDRLEQDIWVYPDGTIKDEPPNFTESLDACFKWLVPKLTDAQKARLPGMFSHNGTFTPNWFWDNPALSLCLAIEELIDGGKP